MVETSIKHLQHDFAPYKKKVLAVLLYGSVAKKTATQRSDVDICIVAPEYDTQTLYNETLSLPYDIHIFETMPLFLQMQVINHHRIIYTVNKYKLGEYFYHFRKQWQDQHYRQQLSNAEVKTLFG
jgi:hypothetical protein